jgi:hypothetical protein
MNASCDHGAKFPSPLTGLIEDFGVVVGLLRKLDVADVSPLRMRLVAGSLIVPCEMGLGGVDAGAEGEPKRLSRSL